MVQEFLSLLNMNCVMLKTSEPFTLITVLENPICNGKMALRDSQRAKIVAVMITDATIVEYKANPICTGKEKIFQTKGSTLHITNITKGNSMHTDMYSPSQNQEHGDF